MSEYWIIDGELIDADADTNPVPDHIAHVRQYLLQQIADQLRDCDCKQSREISSMIEDSLDEDDGIVDTTRLRCQINDSFDSDDPYEEYIERYTTLDRDVISMAFGNERDIDPRLWACKNLGWVRIVGNWIDSWGMQRQKMKRTAYALYEIDEDPQHKWVWENRRNGRLYELTTEEIERATIHESIKHIAAMITEDPNVMREGVHYETIANHS